MAIEGIVDERVWVFYVENYLKRKYENRLVVKGLISVFVGFLHIRQSGMSSLCRI